MGFFNGLLALGIVPRAAAAPIIPAMPDVEIMVNGEPASIVGGETVADLVRRFGLPPERVAIELNTKLVRRADFGATRLSAGDRVEIVTLVGGG
jgi:thiamine biosynthesis protein ThiS